MDILRLIGDVSAGILLVFIGVGFAKEPRWLSRKSGASERLVKSFCIFMAILGTLTALSAVGAYVTGEMVKQQQQQQQQR